MKTLKNISLVFALALSAVATGCAADSPGTGDGSGSGGGGGGGGGGGDDAPKALDATGKYAVSSKFDIESNMPGTVGAVLNNFTAASTDPGKWILDQLIAKMPAGTLKNVLQGAEPFVAGYLDQKINDLAPDFVQSIFQVGKDTGEMMHNFGLNETLEVAKGGADYTSTVSAVGVHLKFDTVETDLAFTDYQLAPVVANNVAVTLDATGKFSVADHKLPLSFGKVLRLGLDNAIIPMIDPNASNLQTLLTDNIDCAAVGQAINDALVQQFGVGGGAGTWSSACTAGLQFGAQAIYAQIDKIDASALEFGINGAAKGVDTNHDYKVDQLQLGKWTGNLSYAGTPAPLSTATFTGARM